MFWLLFWLLSLFIFLVVPAVCVEENRKRWIRRFRECRWTVDEPPQGGTNATRANAGDAYHFVLSKAQEDEIREHFLVDKLKNYTQELADEDIHRPRLNGRDSLRLEDFDVENPKEETEEDTDAEHANQPSVDMTTETMPTTTGATSTLMEATNVTTTTTTTKTITTTDEADNNSPVVAIGSAQSIPDEEKQDKLKDLETGVVSSSTDAEHHNAIFPSLSGANSGEDQNAATTNASVDGVDEISDSGTSDGELMDIHSFDGDQDGTISLPVAGECRPNALPESIQGNTRTEANGCAICLGHFEVGDKVTWSSNPSCQHVFHDDCIRDWLMASGRKHLKRQRREQRRTGNLSYTSDPVAKITGFPMLCPCCRQPFIMPDEEDSEDEKAPTPEVGNTEAVMIASS